MLQTRKSNFKMKFFLFVFFFHLLLFQPHLYYSWRRSPFGVVFSARVLKSTAIMRVYTCFYCGYKPYLPRSTAMNVVCVCMCVCITLLLECCGYAKTLAAMMAMMAMPSPHWPALPNASNFNNELLEKKGR